MGLRDRGRPAEERRPERRLPPCRQLPPCPGRALAGALGGGAEEGAPPRHSSHTSMRSAAVLLVALSALGGATAGCPPLQDAEPGAVHTLTAKQMRCWAKNGAIFTGRPAVVLEVHESWDQFHRDWESHFATLAQAHGGEKRLVFARIACQENAPACEDFPQHNRHSIVFLREGWRPGSGAGALAPSFPAGTAHTEGKVNSWVVDQLRAVGMDQ